MYKPTQEELNVILEKHAKWLDNDPGGEQANLYKMILKEINLNSADLRNADLRYTDLRGSDLRSVNFEAADLSHSTLTGVDLSYANLRNSHLCKTNLEKANLHHANLSGANLKLSRLHQANLKGANLKATILTGVTLSGANLVEANLDFSAFPLYCGSYNIKVDDRVLAQLIFHITRLNISNCTSRTKEVITKLRQMDISNMFCEYRDDVPTIAEFLQQYKED